MVCVLSSQLTCSELWQPHVEEVSWMKYFAILETSTFRFAFGQYTSWRNTSYNWRSWRGWLYHSKISDAEPLIVLDDLPPWTSTFLPAECTLIQYCKIVKISQGVVKQTTVDIYVFVLDDLHVHDTITRQRANGTQNQKKNKKTIEKVPPFLYTSDSSRSCVPLTQCWANLVPRIWFC